MPASHHSVFKRLDALPSAQPTMSKHWRHVWILQRFKTPKVTFRLTQSLA